MVRPTDQETTAIEKTAVTAPQRRKHALLDHVTEHQGQLGGGKGKGTA